MCFSNFNLKEESCKNPRKSTKKFCNSKQQQSIPFLQIIKRSIENRRIKIDYEVREWERRERERE